MINTHKSSKKNIENQRNSYTIKIIKHFEKDNINENKKKDNECLSFFNSKSINDINNAKNIFDNSFREKKISVVLIKKIVYFVKVKNQLIKEIIKVVFSMKNHLVQFKNIGKIIILIIIIIIIFL